MPRPDKSAAPSGRVYLAFGLAAVIGLAVFAIWWFTSPVPLGESSGSSPAAPSFAPGGATEGKPDARGDVPALPRGGTLSGSTDDMEAAVRWLTQAPLVRINRSSDALEPWLAESWTASAGNLIYTVKLRPAIAWSDGTPLTAEDAVASIATVTVVGKPLAARAIDPQTIEITFPAPFAPGLRVLDAHPILPRHAPPERVGLGPFVREKGAFVRNPHYWRKAADGEPLPYLNGVTLTAVSSAEDLSRRSRNAAEADFIDAAIPADDYESMKKLEQDGRVRLFHLGPGLDVDALMFAEVDPRQSDKPWLHSDTFRLAISTAVDRREFCKQVFFGACDAIAGPVSPANAAWFNPDLPLGPGNPHVARAMLGELGLRDRSGDGMLDDAARRAVRFSLLIRRDVPSAARAATFLKETLKLVGVDVAVTPVDGATLRARKMKGNYEAIYDRIEVSDTDPAMNLDFWLTPGPATDWQRQINALMMKNASSFDRIERLQAFAEVQRIYSRHMPALFFGAPHVRVFTSARVLNATPSPLRSHLLWNAESLAALK